jgi:hypothetical protein
MYQINIIFRVENLKDSSKILDMVKKQIKSGEFKDKNNENGYLLNKYTSINIKNPEGYVVGTFRVATDKFIKGEE